MKKHFRMSAIAAFLALLMAVLSPMQAFAASQKLYVSDIRMSDSIEKLENLGYTVLEKDLNAGTTEADVYIGYKTTNDSKEAITDISIMDMKGGYSFGDYEEMLKQQKKGLAITVEIFRDMLSEFRANYKAGSPAAQEAYTALNNYIEDDSGKLLGDLFLDENLSDDDLIKIYMQSSVAVLYCLQFSVTIGLANFGDKSLLEKLSELGPVKTVEDYYDEANELLESVGTIREALNAYLDTNVDIKDAASVEEYLTENSEDKAADFSQNAILYNLLNSYQYGNMTLAEFFMDEDIEAKDLYPLVSVMTKGQIAASRLGGLASLFLSSADKEDYAEAKQKVSDGNKKPDEPISIYTGTDRSMYEGGVALTSDAKRKSASTGDTSWAYGNVDSNTELVLYVAAGISALTSVMFGVAAIICYKVSLGGYTWASWTAIIGNKLATNPLTGWIMRSFATKIGDTLKFTMNGLGAVVLWASVAILAITVIVYFSLEITNYYNPDYTEIPLILMDLKYGENDDTGDWEKYIRYNVVRNENGEASDLNHFEAKQWNAMYTTKDRAAGNPVTVDSLTVKYGDSATPRGYSPVHYFGSTDAFDLNSHCYDNNVDGIFMFFQRDEKAFAANTASVFGSGALSVVTGFGGLIIGALGAVLITKKKKIIAEA